MIDGRTEMRKKKKGIFNESYDNGDLGLNKTVTEAGYNPRTDISGDES